MKRQNGVNHSGTKKSKAYSLRKRSGSVSGRKRRLVCSILAALMLMAGIGMPRTFAADEIVYPTVNNDLEGAGGEVVYDISPVNQGTNIAIGENAIAFVGGGTQESIMSFGETPTETSSGYHIHGNTAAKENLPATISIGQNAYARTESIVVGDFTLRKNNVAIGDTTAGQLPQFGGVASTTVGTNSYANGGFKTTYGSYNVQTSPYHAAPFSLTPEGMDKIYNPMKNAFSTVIGSFNSNESMTESLSNMYSGVANYIGGTANKVNSSNGAVVLGAGNTIKNSLGKVSIGAYDTITDSVSAMQEKLIEGVRTSPGGAALVVGGGNEIDSSTNTQVMGVNNQSTNDSAMFLDGVGNSSTKSQNALAIGSTNVLTDSSYTQLLGDNRTLTDVDNSVVLGSAADTLTTNVDNVTILGYNANASAAGGVALGSESIASVAAGVAGYVPSGVTQSGEAYVWTSTRGAVSVGDANNGITRQITGVAAGTADTDAVNVAQLKAVESKTGSSNVSLKAGNGIRLVKNNVDGSYTISANFQNTGTNVVAFTPNSTVKLPTTSDTGTSDPLSPGTPAVVLKAAMAVAPTTVDTGAATVIGTRISDDTGELTTPDKTDELSIIGDKTNITTTASGTNLIVSLNKDLAVSSVNVNNGPTINENGIDMNNQKITNVADGTIAEGSREAVNGGQVYQLQNQFSNQVNGLSDRINGLDSRIDKVGAGAAALAALHPTDFNPDNKWDFSMGYGNYRSANAIAVGAYYHPNESTIFSLGTTMGNDNNMVNVGVTFKLGKTGNAVNYSRKAAAKKILQLQAELDQVKKARAAQEAKLNQQQAEIDQMKAQIAQLLAQRQ